jgi:hypothetical protein
MGYRKIDPVRGFDLMNALHDKGIIPDACQKVIIEIDVDGIVKVHYRVVGERDLLEVVQSVAAAVAPLPNGVRGIWPAPTTTDTP